MGWILSTQVEIYFLFSLISEQLVQREFRYIMGSRWHGRDLVNTCCDEFWARAGMGGFRQHKWDTFCMLTGVGLVRWIYADIDFNSSLELDKYFQHMWCILCPRWLGRCLVNTCWDAFLSSTRVKINFIFTLAYEGLFNQCWNAFYVFPGIGWVWSTLDEIHFVLNTSYDTFYFHTGIWGVCSTRVEMHFKCSLA